jgi:acetate kinase
VRDAVIVLNAGSSSLKFALFLASEGDPTPLLRGQIERLEDVPELRLQGHSGKEFPNPPNETQVRQVRDHAGALELLLDWFERDSTDTRIVAAGHRVVHGGTHFSGPQPITAAAMEKLTAIAPLAPLHMPHNLAAIRAVSRRRPELPQVACFDTAFHAKQPATATRLALPRAYGDAGLRRYGFHGLSYEYVVGALAQETPDKVLPRRLIAAHLGNGASMCAIQDGRSVATTMGFSTLDGLMMGTRCGSLDPGVLLYLLDHEGLDTAALSALLYDRSGLLGVSGISSDMRTLLASPKPEAAEAIELYCARIVREIGSLAAAMGGLDALVFTGGVGENAAPIRATICAGARWLGVELDEAANARHGPCLTDPANRVTAWVIPTDEELVIARHTLKITNAQRG